MRRHHTIALALLALSLGACGTDGLESLTGLEPPGESPYDPSVGGGGGGSTTGNASGGSGDTGDTGDTGGPAACEDESKRCPQTFTLADAGYRSVEIVGSFAPDGWEVGAPMTRADGVWSVTLGLPWDQEVQYKFRIDGDQEIADPENPNTSPDGAGGDNSVQPATTCEMWDCVPEVFGDFDWRDSVIYFVFVDRFNNGDPSNDSPIGVPALSDWQGGDWAGVTDKIEEGYFEDLGVNTLWLSVPMDNTNDSGLGTDGMDYSAYHAYWPSDLSAPEEHFGTMAELQQLIDTAHDHDLKVLFDYAMNHVHVSSPTYLEHGSWFWPNDNGAGGNCVCGEGCGWDDAEGRRCWFTDYLPDFNFGEQAALDFSTGNAIQWIVDTGVDGFRLDAVKHIEDAWLLELRARVTAEIEPDSGRHFYMVGETFTGNTDTIAYYVNNEMLDGQFDFPLRMEMARTMLMRQGTMSELAAFLDANDDRYGAGIMSTFIGNHDIPRVIHLAEDTPLWDDPWTNGKDRAWDNQPPQPGGDAAYERLATAFALLMTTRGAPLVYYGDEIGLAGGGDPDNRRFMPWDSYSSGQVALREQLQRLTTFRAAHPATRRGTRTTLAATDDVIAYRVEAPGDVVVVAINRADSESAVDGIPKGTWRDVLSDASFSGPDVMVPARTALVLVPE
ncbi:MAG: alpha-amylase family glycosyl hydrolase [Myxococcota bacterium]